ncbi:MAG: DUF4097 family beta strand repeat-containing protein [Bryobacter sp.]|nr:DUF4097 family beta strand repeat-containing protein [Bryobacter sp.]
MKLKIAWVALLLGVASSVGAQEGETLRMSFRDPSQPGLLKVHVMHGSIAVKPHEGNEVVVRSKGEGANQEREEQPEAGMRRIPTGGASLTMEENNNVISVNGRGKSRRTDLEILVPPRTNLNLTSVNGRAIEVVGVAGDLEIKATNGRVRLEDVTGAAVVHSMNGRIEAKFKSVDPAKPMSFSCYNGRIDVTLPAGVKANLKLQTLNGDVFTDFPVELGPDSVAKEESEEGKGAKRVRWESTTEAKVNGGGPDYTFKTYNGRIYIRKGN